MKKTLVLSVGILIIAFGCSKGSSAPEQMPKISIADASKPEGSANANLDFVVTLSNAYSKAVTVSYSTVNGTAKGSEDFTAVNNQSFTIAAGETSGTISISIIGDNYKEANETFQVKLSSPQNATISKETATGTIQNDDSKVFFTEDGFVAPTSYPGYTLTWADEFNTTTLDQNTWTFDLGDGCPTLCGWGNNELQFYTNSPDNIFFQDGKLIIEARKESYGGKEFTSSKIKTSGKKSMKFGRIDVRAKLPTGKGIWPAIWMLPQNNVFGGWPRSGEIDIMELIGSEPSKVHGTLHFGAGPGSVQYSRNYVLQQGTFADQFHVFSIEWKQDQIQWFIDGNLYSTATKADVGANQYPFNEEFYLILNLAVGGNWPGAPDNTTYFPQHMVVDYVRVYQQ